jgi:hypothetical protein
MRDHQRKASTKRACGLHIRRSFQARGSSHELDDSPKVSMPLVFSVIENLQERNRLTGVSGIIVMFL